MKVTGVFSASRRASAWLPHVHALLQRLEGRPAVDEGDDLAVEQRRRRGAGVAASSG